MTTQAHGMQKGIDIWDWMLTVEESEAMRCADSKPPSTRIVVSNTDTVLFCKDKRNTEGHNKLGDYTLVLTTCSIVLHDWLSGFFWKENCLSQSAPCQIGGSCQSSSLPHWRGLDHPTRQACLRNQPAIKNQMRISLNCVPAIRKYFRVTQFSHNLVLPNWKAAEWQTKNTLRSNSSILQNKTQPKHNMKTSKQMLTRVRV